MWVFNQKTLVLRRQVARCTQLVRQWVCLKNLIQLILHTHLIPPCSHGNLVGIDALNTVDADIANAATTDPVVGWLMTLLGVDMTMVSGVAAAIGNIRRFTDPKKLVNYFGLNPNVRRSGEGPAYHGIITKRAPGHSRGKLVGAA